MLKNGFLPFCCAFVPGAGQMYQGYMKRGLSLILTACLIGMVSSLLNPVLLLLVVVWMYSFFDTFNLRAQIIADTAPEDCGELLELCRKAESGELLLRLQDKKQKGDKTPLYQCMGGTSAEKLRRIGRPRPDGKSLSRIFQLLPGNKSDFLLVADSGPGETDEKGLIVPRFGKQPENHVVISLSMGHFCELLLLTRAHYLAWLTASYSRGEEKAFPTQEPEQIPTEPQEPEMAMF